MAIEFSTKSTDKTQSSQPLQKQPASTNVLKALDPHFSARTAVDSSSPTKLLNLNSRGHSGNAVRPPPRARPSIQEKPMADHTNNGNFGSTSFDSPSLRLKLGLPEMLKGGVIMDVMNVEQARMAEEAGAISVMALERVPAMIRAEGGVARMANPNSSSRS